ncbi:hypothetical protein BDR03DRAFT_983114 [Suillus americanus]|nr:hypothetical protein BDR03DRAFT_983114 [Suillus americanus]
MFTDSKKFKHSILHPPRVASKIQGSNINEQLESEADSLNASDSCITKKSKLIFRSYVIVMVRRMLNCHLRTLSLLILDLDFNLDLALALALAFMHLHLTTNRVNTGMMRYSRCLRIIFIPMGIMLPIIIAMILRLQAL